MLNKKLKEGKIDMAEQVDWNSAPIETIEYRILKRVVGIESWIKEINTKIDTLTELIKDKK